MKTRRGSVRQMSSLSGTDKASSNFCCTAESNSGSVKTGVGSIIRQTSFVPGTDKMFNCILDINIENMTRDGTSSVITRKENFVQGILTNHLKQFLFY